MRDSIHIHNAIIEFDKKDSNILSIYENRYCNYCGACFLVCPVDAITYDDGIIEVSDDCIFCQKCLIICSQNQQYRFSDEGQRDMENDSILNVEPTMKKIPFGKIINIYNCKSSREDRKNFAMVGGAVTSLLECALKERIIDAAVAVDFNEGEILPSPKLITDSLELMQAAGSRYLPTFSLKILKEVSESKDISSIAIVSLPCQAYAIEKLSREEETKKLTEKIKLVITLLCGNGLPSRNEVSSFLREKGMKLERGNFKVYREKTTSKPYLNPMNKNRYVYEENSGKRRSFASKRIFRTRKDIHCGILCPDYTGYSCDISAGGSGLSRNIIITRTSVGENLVKEAFDKKYLIRYSKFSLINRIAVNFMGNYKRERVREIYKKLFT
jgi:coenzyme F420-reducing hydrogenase beta subunit